MATLDPFTQADIRKHLLAALAQAVKDGTVVKASTGVYRLPHHLWSPKPDGEAGGLLGPTTQPRL